MRSGLIVGVALAVGLAWGSADRALAFRGSDCCPRTCKPCHVRCHPCAPRRCKPCGCRPCKPCCCEKVTVELEMCHPCTGCKITVPVCLPKCVAKCPPEVKCRKPLVGVQVRRYRWPGGPVVKVRFFADGTYKVHVHRRHH